ncbi:hypothetical protein PQX77_017465 [Marasmius sp. AFHP31]|nr:hypothetical protein PQX77_017465 [Marasmius sp. AFHP31]
MARFSTLSFLSLLAACAVTSVLSAPTVGLVARQDSPIIFPGKVVGKNYQVSQQSTNQNQNQNQNQTETGGANNGTATAATEPLNAKQKAQLVQCNIGLAFLITDLEEVADLVNQIDTSDAAVAKAVTDAKQGIKTAGEGIGETVGAAFALLDGQAPANETAEASGSKVEDGTKLLVSSLTGLNSTQPDVQAAVAKIDDLLATAEQLATSCQA